MNSRPPIRVTMTATVDVPAEERDRAVTDAESVLRGLSAGGAEGSDLTITTMPGGELRIAVTATLGDYRPLWELGDDPEPESAPIPGHLIFGTEEAS